MAAWALLLVRERRTADPLLPPGLLRAPRMGGCLGVAASSVYSAVAVTGDAQLQALGMGPTRAGVALLPVGVGREHTLGTGPDSGRGVAARSRAGPTSAVPSRWRASPPRPGR